MPLSSLIWIFSSEQMNTYCLCFVNFSLLLRVLCMYNKIWSYLYALSPSNPRVPPKTPLPTSCLYFFSSFFDSLLSPVSATHVFMDVIHPLEHGKPSRVHFLSKNDVPSPQQLWIANGSSVKGGTWRSSIPSMLTLCKQSQLPWGQVCINHIKSRRQHWTVSIPILWLLHSCVSSAMSLDGCGVSIDVPFRVEHWVSYL